MMRPWVALGLVGCASWTSAPVSETVSVDLIVQGELRPGDGSSVAVVVNDGQIVDVVSLDAVGERFTSARTLEAAVITAGFVDAHAHPYGLGRLDSQLVLTGINTYAATLTAVDSAPGTAWIVGRGWDQNDWSDAPEGRWPLATDLDAHSAGRPAAIRRVDGHAVWLNTAALTASGVTKDTPDPDGGRIVRDASGAPTGVLVDEAMSLVHTPDDAPADRLVWTARAFELMAEVGLTGAHAMGLSDESLAVFTALAESGEMPVRIWAYVEPESEAAERLMATGPWSVGHLEVVGVKAFADGALGSRGAWLTPTQMSRATLAPPFTRPLTSNSGPRHCTRRVHRWPFTALATVRFTTRCSPSSLPTRNIPSLLPLCALNMLSCFPLKTACSWRSTASSRPCSLPTRRRTCRGLKTELALSGWRGRTRGAPFWTSAFLWLLVVTSLSNPTARP
jgi:hypothetical protein